MKQVQMLFSVCLFGVALTLSGCGSFPELTEDEYREVVNYAAGLVTRYSKGSTDKLIALSADYTPEGYEAVKDIVPAKEETPASPVQAETAQQAPVLSADISGNDLDTMPAPPGEADDTTDETDAVKAPEDPVDTPAPEEQGGQEETAGRTYEAAGEEAANTPLTPIMESWLQTLADGIHVEYTGYSIRTSYPDAESQGAVYAGGGERLLVLDFRLRNTTSGEATINTARYGPAYKVVINGTVQGFTLVTMIDNDLSSMMATLSPGEKRDVVLVMQLPADIAKTVDKLDLRILQGTEMQTVNLE